MFYENLLFEFPAQQSTSTPSSAMSTLRPTLRFTSLCKTSLQRFRDWFDRWPTNYAEQLQNYLVNLYVISKNFHELSEKRHNKRCRFLSALAILINVVMSIWFGLILVTTNEQTHQTLWNFASQTEVSKAVFLLAFIACVICSIARLILFLAECHDRLQLFSDLHPLLYDSPLETCRQMKLLP